MSGYLLWIGLTLIVGVSHYVGGEVMIAVGTILMAIGCVLLILGK